MTAAATAPNLTPACQPNLPALRYTAVANRDTIGGVDGSLFGGPAGSVVNLARRVPTSGTQSASNIRFLDKPCATGTSQGALEPARATDSTGTAVVTEQSSTGGVKTALNTATGANQFGLGVMSMENTPAPTATADRWAFVKLDRVSPNSDAQQRAEAMDGSYNFWFELAAFTAGGSVSPASAAGAALIAAVNTTLGESDLKGIFCDTSGRFQRPHRQGRASRQLLPACGPVSRVFRYHGRCNAVQSQVTGTARFGLSRFCAYKNKNKCFSWAFEIVRMTKITLWVSCMLGLIGLMPLLVRIRAKCTV